MEGIGGYIWFVGLGAALIVLAAAMIYASRGRARGGDPNNAWKQAAAESGHPEVAKPDGR